MMIKLSSCALLLSPVDFISAPSVPRAEVIRGHRGRLMSIAARQAVPGTVGWVS